MNTIHTIDDTRNGQQPAVSETTALAALAAIGQQPLAAIGRQALHTYERRLRKRTRKLRDGHDNNHDDADTIHDARVAAREVRALLEMLETAPDFKQKRLRRLRKRLGKLARTLGAVRDMDVLLEHLAEYEAQHAGTHASLSCLRHELHSRRKASSKALRRLLASPKTKRLLKHLHQFSQLPKKGVDEPQVLVRHFAGSALWQRYEAILRYETTLPNASAETLHKLRIACKQLRYNMQLFELTMPAPAPVREIQTTLKAAQDQLGQLHDLLFTSDLIHHLPRQSKHSTAAADATTALVAYDHALTSESATLRSNVGPLWERLSGLPMRQMLATLLIVL